MKLHPRVLRTVSLVVPVLLAGVASAQTDLSTWQTETFGSPLRPPVWSLAPNLAYQTKDSDVASFAYGGEDVGSKVIELALTGFHIAGFSEDAIGLALGVGAGTATNPAADFLLLKWDGVSALAADDAECTTGGAPSTGLRLYRVTGVPTLDELWQGVDQDAVCSPLGTGLTELAAANTLGATGWGQNTTYAVRMEFGPCSLRVSVDGVEQFLVGGDFSGMAAGKLGIFCMSQRVLASDVTYAALPNPGSLEVLGAGTMGSDSVPQILATGCPLENVGFGFEITNSSATNTGVGALAIGFNNPSFLLTAYGATLLTSAEIVLGINAVAGGSFTLPFSLNPGAPVGADFFAQAGWFDLAAMGNVAFTNGVRVVVGE